MQTCLPKGTSSRLISTRYRGGRTASSATIVRSGVVACTTPHRFVTRWTWMSTLMRCCSQAIPSAAGVRTALDSLPLMERLAIELAFYEGYTHTEIAERLEQPLGTVKTRIRQGLLKLRDHLTGGIR